MRNNLFVLGAQQINHILAGKEQEIMEIVKNAYLLHKQGETVLPHSIFLRFPDDERNRIIGLPAYIGGSYQIAGMKWISSFPGNIEKHMERASAAIFLNEMSTGRTKAVLEGSIISAKRTAASAAIAAQYLHANKKEESIGFAGCGRINKEVLLFLKCIFPNIKKIYLFDLVKERMKDFISWYRDENYEFEPCSNIEELFSNTKLISFATTAGEPFIEEIRALTAEHTILGISLRDFAPSVIDKVHNIVDDYAHVCRERTSIHLTYQTLHTNDFVAGSIADVVSHTVRARNPAKAVLYSPFGLGILDIALASYVYEAALHDNLGTVIEDFSP